MKKIPLTQGKSTIIDDRDFDLFGASKWFAQWNPKTKSYYAGRNIPATGIRKQKTILLHREIIGAEKGIIVDHKNHNTLDNRKKNLRTCTNLQNSWHRKGANKNSISGIRGVSWRKASGRWCARIAIRGIGKWLGTFIKKVDAISAYRKANKRYFGEFSIAP